MLRWLAALLIIAAAIISLLMLGERREPLPPPAPVEAEEEQPDYWMESSRIERFDEDGERLLLLDSDRLAHFPSDERSEMRQVRAEQRGPESLLWEMHAEHGPVTGDRSLVALSGDVRMERRAPHGPSTWLYTDSLEFLPRDDLARTDDPVRMERGATITTGIGLHAAMAEDRLIIKQEVRTRHVSPTDPN